MISFGIWYTDQCRGHGHSSEGEIYTEASEIGLFRQSSRSSGCPSPQHGCDIMGIGCLAIMHLECTLKNRSEKDHARQVVIRTVLQKYDRKATQQWLRHFLDTEGTHSQRFLRVPESSSCFLVADCHWHSIHWVRP